MCARIGTRIFVHVQDGVWIGVPEQKYIVTLKWVFLLLYSIPWSKESGVIVELLPKPVLNKELDVLAPYALHST